MERRENSESASWFIDNVWPLVCAKVPDATLVVAGFGPPDTLRRRTSDSVSVPGYVADLDHLHRSVRVFVAPLLTGAGIKLKVLGAMAYGLPVVATPVAAEGIVDRAGTEAFGGVTSDPTAMAHAIVALLRDDELATAIGARGKRWVSRAHDDFNRSVDGVAETYRELVSRVST
jgi:glycosyltransferase involved in cell wall biosynthesis